MAYMIFTPYRGIKAFHDTYEDARKHAGPDAVDYDPEARPRYTVWTIVKCAPTVRKKYLAWCERVRLIVGVDTLVYERRTRDWRKYAWSQQYGGMILSLDSHDTAAWLAATIPFTGTLLSPRACEAYVTGAKEIAMWEGLAIDLGAAVEYICGFKPAQEM